MRLKKVLRVAGLVFLLGATTLLIFFLQSKRKYDRRQATRAHYRANLREVVSDGVQILKDTFATGFADEKRTLRIYLPPDYDQGNKRYPVLYFFDGQALFNDLTLQDPEWQVDEVMDSIYENTGSGGIVIGIDASTTRRDIEYNPYHTEPDYNGKHHAAWLVEKLKPWVDSTYRTRPEPAKNMVGGASLGGLMAYYTVMTYPESFQRAIVLSPSFWASEAVFQLHEDVSALQQMKLYFNVGAEESSTMRKGPRKMAKTLLTAGVHEDRIRFEKAPKLGHWHLTWRAGFRAAYPWILE